MPVVVGANERKKKRGKEEEEEDEEEREEEEEEEEEEEAKFSFGNEFRNEPSPPLERKKRQSKDKQKRQIGRSHL